MKITKISIILSIIISGASFSSVASAKDNFNQSLVEYNNTSSYVTDNTSNTWVLNKDVTGYPLNNNQPDYDHPVQLNKYMSGSIVNEFLTGYNVVFTNQTEPLYVPNFKANTYSYKALNVNKAKYQQLLKIERKWRKTLSKKQVKAIGNYTNDGYSKINSYLRSQDKSTSSDVIDETNLINSAIMKFKTPFRMTIYRGINEAGLNASLNNQPLQAGKIYQDAAFSSSSISHKIATGFQSSILLKINVPAGYNGAYVAPISINSPEKEFLLKPNAKMVVTKIQSVTTYYSMHGQIGDAKHPKKIKAKPTKIKYKMVTMNLIN